MPGKGCRTGLTPAPGVETAAGAALTGPRARRA